MGFGFDTNEYERTVGTGSNDPLPIAFYGLVITRATIKTNGQNAKDPNGKYLEVEFDITDPVEHTRRKFWDKFNILNSNATAQRIGREHLSDLLNAIGLGGDAEPEDMVGAPCNGYLLIEPGSGGYGPKNKCGKYLPTGTTEADYQAWYASKKGSAPAKTGQVPERKAWGAAPAATTQAAPAGETKKAPWKK